MRRREVLAFLVRAATLPWPIVAHAEQHKVPVVGILSPAPSETTPLFDAFRAKLEELGWIEGQSIKLHFHLARGRPDAIPALAAELVKTSPNVIVSDGAFSTRTLKALTATVPIVGILGPDPVAIGLVASLARPSGNITGVTILATDLHPKRIELLKEVVPTLSRLAVLWDRGIDPRGLILDAMSDYAKQGGLRLDVLEDEGQAGSLAALLAPDRLKDADAVLVSSGPTHFNNREVIVKHIMESAKPAIFPQREYVTAGGLMSYGPDVTDVFRRLAELVDRILKGSKAGDIPVEQTVRVPFVLNLRTAKAIGLVPAPMVLLRADEVIE
jgi:putative ABC transport system substrate-binding protein